MSYSDVDCLNSGRVGRSREGEEGLGTLKRIVPTVAIVVGRRNRCWGLGRICLVVVDCCNSVWLICCCATGAQICSHEDCRFSMQRGFNENVSSLTYLGQTVSI